MNPKFNRAVITTKQIFIGCSILTLFAFTTQAQDKRQLKTKVADVLAYLPTEDNAQAERLFVELSNLGEDGIRIVTDQVKPNGDPDGVPYRFGVSLLTHYATNPLQKAVIEKAYLYALQNAANTEVKSYFLDNLKWIGSDAAVDLVSSYITDKDLYEQAISTLQSIGTSPARKALLSALNSHPPAATPRLIQALGELREMSALSAITNETSGTSDLERKNALWSLALLGDPSSSGVLLTKAREAGFKNEPLESTNALVKYMNQLTDQKLLLSLAKKVLESTTDLSQQHYRLAALEALVKAGSDASAKTLIKELNRYNDEYRNEVLNIAVTSAMTADGIKIWLKEYKHSPHAIQAEILYMLARANTNEAFVLDVLVPALSSPDMAVRQVAAQAIATTRNKKFAGALVDYLATSTDDSELTSARAATLQLIDKDNSGLIAGKIDQVSSKNKVVMIHILGERRAKSSFDIVMRLTGSPDPAVRSAALAELSRVSGSDNIGALLTRLAASNDADEVKALQTSISSSVNAGTATMIDASYDAQKMRLLPVLAYVSDKSEVTKVLAVFNDGSPAEKKIAFEALLNWQNSNAIRTLLAIARDPGLQNYSARADSAGVRQVVSSSLPDDEKLLLLKEFMAPADKKNKVQIIRAAGNVRTFLSLAFVVSYLDDPDLSAAAGRAAMQLSLPTADAQPGMTGNFVRQTLERIKTKLTGQDSQYELIDVTTYLSKLPFSPGYEPIFNSVDLSGWHGLVGNPITRAKMSREALAKNQKEADGNVGRNWSVKDGAITFSGDGANLCTIRPYGDFEMLVDWKISKNGDSGIYLRGSPQVQIWDVARTDAGAQVGSGGLYNNKNGRSTPLTVADNPIGEWNTFRIKIIGNKVTVLLNGILVVDNVVMENYWDPALPIFTQNAIELQAHGTDIAFRNLYVKALGGTPFVLSASEKDAGFVSLFNGTDLDLWGGNKADYVVEDNAIAVYPANESHGNLRTIKEYSDFILRFEFQLTSGANNGIGIHGPAEGDAAYLGKEIQILDDTAPVYAKLEPWQYHGSVYGTIAAKRGFLKPVGYWNDEEIEVKGDYIKVTLNGTVITEGDVKKLTKNGTLDHKEHPGILSHKGPIQFLGHGSTVRFRNIRIKETQAGQ